MSNTYAPLSLRLLTRSFHQARSALTPPLSTAWSTVGIVTNCSSQGSRGSFALSTGKPSFVSVAER